LLLSSFALSFALSSSSFTHIASFSSSCCRLSEEYIYIEPERQLA
jgi:hypothetical protein